MDKFAARKATAPIRVVGKDGEALKNTEIRMEMKNHQFLFGCGAFETLALMQAKDEQEKAFYADRIEKWLGLFNFGTLPFYWGRYEREQGKTMEPETLKAARWLKDRGVTVKGHPLCWHTACANWLMQYDNKEIMRLQLERIHRDVGAFRGLIDMWDVINEVVIMPVFDKYDNAITRLCKEKGRIQLVKEVFEAAKETNPGATLLINDFNTSQSYEILIEGLLHAGVPISVIGIQSHQHQGYWGLEKLHTVLERFSHFGLPIHFTENTLISGDLMPAHIEDLNDWQVPEWPTTPEGEERQAREAAEMYTELFAHPLVEGITTWDPADGAWLGAPSGLMRKDSSLKPVYHKLHSLIHGEWKTDVTLKTDDNGFVTMEGYKGQYEAVADAGKAMFDLKDNQQLIIILK
ncbi:MAG: endo-1,4-beta-xylanase [Clostridia bacterium]|nr:endo-1,4-beta-xylanase [Clostridia bacterium]